MTNKIKSFHIIATAYFLILCIWFYISNKDLLGCDFISTSKNTFYFEPFASIWFQNFVLQNFNSVLTNLLCIIVVPFSIFLLLVNIYSRYISTAWASFLALLSLSVYENLSFHSYLGDIFNSHSGDRPVSIPLIFEFPLPGFSTLYFLVAYFFLTTYKKIRLPLITLFSLVVATDFYINAIDALFLVTFWFIYFPYKIYREKLYSLARVVLISVLQLLLIFACIFPGLSAGKINPELSPVNTLPLYNILLYLLLPVALMGALYFIQRIDLYEIVFKFRHIYAFLMVEVLVILLTTTRLLPIDLHVLRSRILQFFIHLFYFVPVIYYVSRPVYNYTRGSEAGSFAAALRKNLYLLYSRGENIIAITLTLLLVIYNLFPILAFFNK